MRGRPILNWLLPLPLLLAVPVLLSPPAWAQAPATTGAAVLAPPGGEVELLPVEDAFRFQVLTRGPVLRIEVRAADGYYLYRDRLRVAPAAPGLTLGEPLMPPGVEHEDPLLGRVQVYRGRTAVDLPVLAAPAAGSPPALAITSQGCADVGVCYPPDTRLVAVAPAPAAPEQSVLSSGGDAADPLARLTAAFGGGGAAEFLPVDEAFRLEAAPGPGGTVVVRFRIADGYYLYRHRMGFRVLSPQGASAGEAELPTGKLKRDDFFGEQEVYFQEVAARVPVTGADRVTPMELQVEYQGCAEAGLCYPPQERVLALTLATGAAVPGAPPGAPILSETDRLARSLIGDALGLVLASFFLAGLLLAFTPCVLPMIPILSAIIAGQQETPGPRRGFVLSLTYVLAMSLTYTAAGVVAGLFGQNLQALFQHPAVLMGFSALFVALALAMFGAYTLQLPAVLQSRLAVISGRQRGGSLAGVGVMGVLSALIVGPCVAAPLAAALIVIGSSGDPVRGGLALFALSLGMGMPLLAVGVFGPRLLPRVGPWMTLVKHVFGIMLLAVAVYLLSRLLPDALVLALWAGLAVISAAVLLFSGRASPAGGGARRRLAPARAVAGALVLAYGATLAVGAASGARDPLRPLDGIRRGPVAHLDFQRVKSVADLEQVIRGAAEAGRTVMLDFYADWCVSCKEMERDTFSQPAVQAALGQTVLVQADVTAYDADDRALLERYGLHGPPAILFFGPDGRERRAYRVIGFMNATEFGAHVVRARRS